LDYAKKFYGISVIPEMDCFAHAPWLGNLTIPRYIEGDTIPDGKKIGDAKKDDDITDNEKEYDFVIYDNSGHRARDNEIDLTGDKVGSKMAMQLIENVLRTFAKDFITSGNYGDFSIRGDEYFECLEWDQLDFNDETKQKIVDGFYAFGNKLTNILTELGFTTHQFNDDFL
jgi:hypothetical protein